MNILLIGYFGFGNAGDHILLEKGMAFLDQRFQSPRYCVLYGQDDEAPIPLKVTKEILKLSPFSSLPPLAKVTYCRRSRFFQLLTALRKSKITVFPGGGLFQDNTSFKSLLFYTGMVFLSKLFGNKIYLISQGVSPLKRRVSRILFRRAVAMSSGISVRDEASFHCLNEMGIKEEKIVLASDLAFDGAVILNNSPNQVKQVDSLKAQYKSTKSASNLKVGLSLREATITSFTQSSLKFFLNALNTDFVFLNCQEALDYRQVHLYTGLRAKIKDQFDIENHFYQDGPFSFPIVIAMRYHACVWAALHGIPFLALAYDDKLKNLAQELGQEVIDLRDQHISTQAFEQVYLRFLERYNIYKKSLSYEVPKLIQRVQANDQLFSD